MNNTTLADFIENPYYAMRNGYYPDFMSVGALMADTVSDYKGISQRVLPILFGRHYSGTLSQVIWSLLVNLFKFIFELTVNLLGIPLFPIWWVAIWILIRNEYKNEIASKIKLNGLL